MLESARVGYPTENRNRNPGRPRLSPTAGENNVYTRVCYSVQGGIMSLPVWCHVLSEGVSMQRGVVGRPPASDI